MLYLGPGVNVNFSCKEVNISRDEMPIAPFHEIHPNLKKGLNEPLAPFNLGAADGGLLLATARTRRARRCRILVLHFLYRFTDLSGNGFQLFAELQLRNLFQIFVH